MLGDRPTIGARVCAKICTKDPSPGVRSDETPTLRMAIEVAGAISLRPGEADRLAPELLLAGRHYQRPLGSCEGIIGALLGFRRAVDRQIGR